MTPTELADALEGERAAMLDRYDNAHTAVTGLAALFAEAAATLRQLDEVRRAADGLDFTHTESCSIAMQHRKRAGGKPWPCTCGMEALGAALARAGGAG